MKKVLLGIGGVFLATGFLIWLASLKAIDWEKYDINGAIGGTADNGEIGDHLIGPADAPVKIIEYADFQCGGCASANQKINKLVKEQGGKVAVVFRNFLIDGHPNATAAAAAAEAAGLQGYWAEYSTLLFRQQSEWGYASGEERTKLLGEYFEKVSNGKGDTKKFLADMASGAVMKKIGFDMKIGKKIDVPGTPAFYIDGKLIEWGNKAGGRIEINGKMITWDSPRGAEADFIKLFNDIVAAKLRQ